MTLRSVWLAAAVASFLFAGAAWAGDPARSASPGLVLAQNDRAACPPDANCADAPAKRNRDARERDRGKGRENGRAEGQRKKPARSRDQAKPDAEPAEKARQRPRRERVEQGDGRGARKRSDPPPAVKAEPGPRRRSEQPRQSEQRQGEQKRGEQRSKPRKPVAGEASKNEPRRTQDRPRANGARKDVQQQERAKKDAQERRRRKQPEERRAREQQKPRQAQPSSQADDSGPTAGQKAVRRKHRDGDERRGAAEQRAPRGETTAPNADRAKPAAEAVEKGREERRRKRQENRDRRPREQADRPSRPTPPADEASTVEEQLEAQGQAEEARRVRELRRKLRRQRQEAQASRPPKRERDRSDEDRPRDRDDGGRARRRDRETVERRGDRLIVRFGTQIFIEPEEVDDRLLYRARDVEVEELGNGRTRTIVYRENGARVVTVRNRYGEIVSRVRHLPNGEAIVLIDERYPDIEPEPFYFEAVPLPPLVVPIPRAEYIVETAVASPPEIQAALTAPPVEQIERAYTLDEVRRSDRLRDKMRRVDLDTITFDFGSAVIANQELDALDRVGEGLEEVLRSDPDEVFLIEGHTDAVGSEDANLILSDERAEAVAVALSEDFDIPPENLVTQGYGEAYLKVPTEAPERENRRVTIRRITPLLNGVAQQ